jgi:23S rRNA pseudouridine2605 synthase
VDAKPPSSDDPSPGIRIARHLADCGVASRRKAEDLIIQGRIAVNGLTISDLGRRIHPERDLVSLDGRPVDAPVSDLTLALNKPIEVLVTRSDTRGRRTVYDLLPQRWAREASRLRYAGRLDFLSTGLLLLTTDGELINRLVHPRHHVSKTYEVTTNHRLGDDEIRALREGLLLEDGRTQPCEVSPLPSRSEEPWRYQIILREGRNRQVRRMIEAVDARVSRLHRAAIGGLTLNSLSLARGEFRPLEPHHLAALFEGDEP